MHLTSGSTHASSPKIWTRATWLLTALLTAALPTLAAKPPAVEWTVTLPRAAKGNSLCQCADGSYVVTGRTDIGDSVYGNVYLAKVSSSGALLWEFGCGGPREDEGCHVEQTPDGGYVVSGWTSASGAALLLRMNASGRLLWQKTYNGPMPVTANSVLSRPGGGYLLVCDAEEDYEILLVITDTSGVETVRHIYGSATSSRTARGGVLCSDGGYLVAGWTDSVGPSDNVYCAKTDRNGALQWQKVYGGADGDKAYAVVAAPDGGYALAGCTASRGNGSSDFYLLKVNSQGTYLWSRTYGAPDEDVAYSICRTTDRGYVLAGVSGHGPAKPHVVRTNSNGSVVWTKTFEGSGGHSWATAIRQTQDGGYIITGPRYGARAELFLTKLAPERKSKVK
jgi:hypothetical protein